MALDIGNIGFLKSSRQFLCIYTTNFHKFFKIQQVGQFLVFSNSPWFSSVSASRFKTAFFQVGVSFLEGGIQETLRLLIDLLRMIYFLLNAWAFPAFKKGYCNTIFLFLMLTDYNSVSRGLINLKLTLLPSIIFKLQVQRGFPSKYINPQSYKTQCMALPESNCW